MFFHSYRIHTHLSARVKNLNPPRNKEDIDVEEQFRKAMALVGSEFEEFITYVAQYWLPARSLVKDAILKRFEVGIAIILYFFSIILNTKNFLL